MPSIIKEHSDLLGNILIIVTVLAGYLGTLLSNWEAPFAGALPLFLLLGLLYTLLLTIGFSWLQSAGGRLKAGLYFGVATLILAGILYLANFSTTWIVALPLAGQSLALSWLGTTLAAGSNFVLQLIVIWVLSGDLGLALRNAPALAVAMLFVMIFTWVTIQSEQKNEEIIHLAQQLQTANQQLREYATKAEDLAIIKERNRMAREIHDSLGHYLTVVNVQLEAARSTLEQDPAKAKAAIGKAQQLTQEGLSDVRRSVASLRESPLENRPVPEAIAELIAEAEAAGLVANLFVAGTPRPLPANTALTLYRATQEALTNVRKHARASKVDVALEFTPEETVALTVTDNGVGSAAPEGGFGLMGIRERVQLLRGSFQITTAVGEGFRLDMSMPG